MNTKYTLCLVSLLALSAGCATEDKQQAAAFSPPDDFQYVVDRIRVSPDGERIVSDLHDHFLVLIAGGEIGRGTTLPTDDRYCSQGETHTMFGWAYYISPNELRGFEISIPTEHVHRTAEQFVTTVPLIVDKVTQKQTVKIVVMKQKPTR